MLCIYEDYDLVLTARIAENGCELAYCCQRWRMLFSLRHDNDDADDNDDDNAKVEIPDGDWLTRKISRDKLSLK